MVRSAVRTIGVGITCAALMALFSLPVGAQGAGQSLGSVSLNKKVMANGEALAPGTYTLRLLPEGLKGAVGQTPAESRWVEFVRGGKVVGKEVATILSGPEARAVTKGDGPASGGSKIQMLKGNEYLRIWVNRGGTHYLVHLPLAKS